MNKAIWKGLAAAVVVAATAAACGGGGSSSTTPTSPTPPTSTTPPTTTPPPTTPPTDSATITIGTDGRVSPSSVTILRGGRVTMINNDTREHDMSSDPHPEHSQCPEINQIGFLARGQQRTSGNLNTSRTCGFHDHLRDGDANLKGTIVIQ